MIAEQFLRRFNEELAKLKVGMPWEKGVSITPLPGAGQSRVYDAAASSDAEAKGARVMNEGGGARCRTFFYPAVVYPGEGGHEALP